MKEMTKTKRVGDKGIYVLPTRTSKHAITQKKGSHAPYSQAEYRYITYVHTNHDKQIKKMINIYTMLKDVREDIQVRESTCQTK